MIKAAAVACGDRTSNNTNYGVWFELIDVQPNRKEHCKQIESKKKKRRTREPTANSPDIFKIMMIDRLFCKRKY